MNNYQLLWLPPLVWWFLNEATVDSVLQDAPTVIKFHNITYTLTCYTDPALLMHSTVSITVKTFGLLQLYSSHLHVCCVSETSSRDASQSIFVKLLPQLC